MFRAVVLASLAAPFALEACGGDGQDAASGPDAGFDATAGDDASPAVDAGVANANDATLDGASVDAPDDATIVMPSTFDAPPYPYDGEACAPGPPQVMDRCAYTVALPCGHAPVPGCELGVECEEICTLNPTAIFGCYVWNVPGCGIAADAGADPEADVGDAEAGIGEAGPVDAQPMIVCETCIGVGRRPAGLAKARARTTKSAAEAGRASSTELRAIASYLARAAHLEAASVIAFERLRDDLVGLSAPPELLAEASRARDDERRHARVVAALARARGGVVPRVALGPRRTAPSPAELARDNAVEGCVRETFGALLARVQAERAPAGDVRRAMRRIADDEARHAALAWAIARWLEPRLDARARRRVRQATRRAIKKLVRETEGAASAGLARALGLPEPHEARSLLSDLDRSLWRRRAGRAARQGGGIERDPSQA